MNTLQVLPVLNTSGIEKMFNLNNSRNMNFLFLFSPLSTNFLPKQNTPIEAGIIKGVKFSWKLILLSNYAFSY